MTTTQKAAAVEYTMIRRQIAKMAKTSMKSNTLARLIARQQQLELRLRSA